jgi:hypothetical protein
MTSQKAAGLSVAHLFFPSTISSVLRTAQRRRFAETLSYAERANRSCCCSLWQFHYIPREGSVFLRLEIAADALRKLIQDEGNSQALAVGATTVM